MTTRAAKIGEIDYAKNDPQTWGTQIADENETTSPEYRSKPPMVWIDTFQVDRPALSHEEGTYADEANSTLIVGSLKDRPYVGRVFCCDLRRSEQDGYFKVVLSSLAESLTASLAASLYPVDRWDWMLHDPTLVSSETGRTTVVHYPFDVEERSTVVRSPEHSLVELLHSRPIQVTAGRANAVRVEPPLRGVIRSFAEGASGVRPSVETVATAARIVDIVIENSTVSEIEFDESDGTLEFEFRLERNDHLVVGELSLNGDLRVNVYNDRHPDADAAIDEIWVEHLPNASAEDLIALF